MRKDIKGWALDVYYRNGDLSVKDSRYSAEELLNAGKWLGEKHYWGFPETLQSKRVDIEIVDGGGQPSAKVIARRLDAQSAYFHAMAALPLEYHHVVRTVCVENALIAYRPELSKYENRLETYHLKRKLAQGLTYLAEYLRYGRNKKRY